MAMGEKWRIADLISAPAGLVFAAKPSGSTGVPPRGHYEPCHQLPSIHNPRHEWRGENEQIEQHGVVGRVQARDH